ncbi:MAG: acyl carrier protein [Bradymonadia bacterium]|jgi:acyl carrier protein
MTDITTRLITLSGKHFGVETIGFTAESDFFDSLGIDSLKALELLSELEMEFDVEIPDYELQGVKTFGQLAEKIEERV